MQNLRNLWIGLLVALLVIPNTIWSQDDFEVYLRGGKQEFQKDFEYQNYQKAIVFLQEALKIKPNDQEAHYFLGYAFGRLNSKDGQTMDRTQLQNTLNSSFHLEKAIAIDSVYRGELVVLDPYAKLTSEWGSLSMSYNASGKADSALWALKEGKKRGAFSSFLLDRARQTLRDCADSAILLSFGDLSSFPLWYIQQVEAFRSDVMVVDLSLLYTPWYVNYLRKDQRIQLQISRSKSDTIKFRKIENSLFKLGDLEWNYNGRYEGYLLSGEILLWDILKSNFQKYPIHWSRRIDPNSTLGLFPHLIRHSSVLTTPILGETTPSAQTFLKETQAGLKSLEHVNKNSIQERREVDAFRLESLRHFYVFYRDSSKKEWKNLKKIIVQNYSPQAYPFVDAEMDKLYHLFLEQ